MTEDHAPRSHQELAERLLPDGMTSQGALDLLHAGREGRMQLEARLGHLICGIGNCLLELRHRGKCVCLVESGSRKRKAKDIFEQGQGSQGARCTPSKSKKPEPIVWIDGAWAQHNPTAGRKSVKKLPQPLRRAAAQAADVESEQRMLPLLRAPPSAQREGGEPGAESVRAAGLELGGRGGTVLEHVPNMRTAPTFLATNSQAHPNPFSPIADLADNALEAKARRLDIELSAIDGLVPQCPLLPKRTSSDLWNCWHLSFAASLAGFYPTVSLAHQHCARAPCDSRS